MAGRSATGRHGLLLLALLGGVLVGKAVAQTVSAPAILVETFTLVNPGEGPAVEAEELTRRLCRELGQNGRLPLDFESDAERIPREARYRLSGEVEWVRAGQTTGVRVKIDARLISVPTGYTVAAYQTPGTSLPAAARDMAAAFSNLVGKLRITSDQDNATVYLDDWLVGPAPCQVEDLLFDRYTVKVSCRDGPVREEVVEVSQAVNEIKVWTREPIRVEAFNLVNPSDGPAVAAEDLTRRLCQDLDAGGPLPLDYSFDSASTRRSPRYVLGGDVTWVAASSGPGTRVRMSLHLVSASTSFVAAECEETGLSLPEASQKVAEAFSRLTGTLSVASNQPGATVYLDGAERGRTPCQLDGLAYDRYHLKLTHPTRIDEETDVEVNRSVQLVRVSMDERPVDVELSTVAGWAEVYVDGVNEGTTPLRLTFRDARSRSIRLEGNGRVHFRKMKVKPNQTYDVQFDLDTGKATGDPILHKPHILFPYSDFHLGLTYGVGVPSNRRFRDVISRSHSVGLSMGFCWNYFRLNSEGSYGLTEYNFRGSKLSFLDGAGQEVSIGYIKRASAGADLSLMLPLRRTSKGRGEYPFFGFGYRVESIEVEPEWNWTSTDGSDRAYVALGDEIHVINNHRYWTGGIVLGTWALSVRKSMGGSQTDWVDVSIGVQGVFPSY